MRSYIRNISLGGMRTSRGDVHVRRRRMQPGVPVVRTIQVLSPMRHKRNFIAEAGGVVQLCLDSNSAHCHTLLILCWVF